jgi:hypothetical protein
VPCQKWQSQLLCNTVVLTASSAYPLIGIQAWLSRQRRHLTPPKASSLSCSNRRVLFLVGVFCISARTGPTPPHFALVGISVVDRHFLMAMRRLMQMIWGRASGQKKAYLQSNIGASIETVHLRGGETAILARAVCLGSGIPPAPHAKAEEAGSRVCHLDISFRTALIPTIAVSTPLLFISYFSL